MAEGESSKNGKGSNPDTPAFDMASMNAATTADANAVSASDARLLDFNLDKPEVWFTMVEALFEDCNISASKIKYNKVLYWLPVSIIKSLASLINNIADYPGWEYAELKSRILAPHGRSRWEKLDSLLTFPKMGANEWLSVVLSQLNSLKLATLEELYNVHGHLPLRLAGLLQGALCPVQVQDRGGVGHCG
jgi:hypothetical protein